MTLLCLLSPAKRLRLTPEAPAGGESRPDFEREAALLCRLARKLERRDHQRLFAISRAYAERNHARFRDLAFPPTDGKAAAWLFDGDTYAGFRAREFEPDDLAFAQAHVRILSGLYGLLRPLDLIGAHRLDMGTRLANRRGRDLYAFWGSKLTRHINRLIAGWPAPAIVNLASREYFKAIQAEALNAPLITPIFKEVAGAGPPRVLALHAKRARGAMARHVVARRIDDPAKLKDFRGLGYRFVAEASSAERWEFHRHDTL